MAILICCAPLHANEYRIDSQERFEALREASFSPGDAILFQRGLAFDGMFSPSGSGTEDAPITIRTYGDGDRPVINAKGKNIAGLLLKNASFWEVHGLEITNTDGTDGNQGMLFGIYVLAEGTEETLRHVYINDCYIHDVNGKVAGKRRGGIHVHVKESNTATFGDLRITNNRIERVGGVGIGNQSSCGRIEFRADDEIEHNLWTNVYVAGNFVGDTGRNSIIARVSKDAVYEHNTLANSSRFSTGHSIFCFNTSGMKIQYNEAYGNVGPGGIDRGGFDADYNCTRTFIQYNYSHDNNWFCGIMKRRNRHVVIRYNISQNDREGIYFYGFEREQKAEDIHIYNNTHYVRKGLDVAVFPDGRTPINTLFENNIFFFEDKGRWGENAKGINTQFRNNLYFNIAAYEADSSPINVNPMFIHPGAGGTDIDLKNMRSLEGYRLNIGSPCLGTGITINSFGGRDLMGIKIPAGKTVIGAFGVGSP
ncbi:MAG: right-handed parallel beta-helix repeat-containing protein [Planctomycetes bacterium]|nr:right-handed parallel beta-helix repeat-containing protein [Planctomycetota bacterium]